MTVNGHARLVELHVLVDVSGVGATALDHEGDGTPDIDLLVASLGGHPVGGILAADQALADGALGLEVLGNDIDVTGPGTLGATALKKFKGRSEIEKHKRRQSDEETADKDTKIQTKKTLRLKKQKIRGNYKETLGQRDKK